MDPVRTEVMRNRFVAEEVWRTLDFDAEECVRHVRESESQRFFRAALFSPDSLQDRLLKGRHFPTPMNCLQGSC